MLSKEKAPAQFLYLVDVFRKAIRSNEGGVAAYESPKSGYFHGDSQRDDLIG